MSKTAEPKTKAVVTSSSSSDSDENDNVVVGSKQPTGALPLRERDSAEDITQTKTVKQEVYIYHNKCMTHVCHKW